MAESSNPSTFDPRLARVVKIKVTDEAGAGTIGSGYLIAPGLVLTAGHVLWRDGDAANGDYPMSALRVRVATGASAGRSLTVSQAILLGEVSGVDVAVLVVPGLEPVAGTTVVGARFITTQPVPGCWMIGYPKAAHQDGTVRPEHVGVSLLPVNGSASGRIAVKVDTTPAKREADWKGLSGSGVVDAQNRLLGVLVDVQVRWKDRLAVVPFRTIAEAVQERVGKVPALGPLLDIPVVEEVGKDPLFDHSKFPPRLIDLDGESLFEALHFRNRVVPFVEDGVRDQMVEGALAWVREVGGRPDVQAAVVTGPAGVGKSRLAAEICDQLAVSDPWWRAGFADHDKLITAPVPTVPTVVVIDYPERHPEALGRFLTRIHEQGRAQQLQAPIRVLLLARDQQSWFEHVRTSYSNLGRLITHRIELDLQAIGSTERDEHAAAAFRAFCDGFDIAEASRPGFVLGEQAKLDRPLLVHAAALLTAWSHVQPEMSSLPAESGPVVTNQGRLLDDLINAEVKRLQRLRRGDSKEGSLVFTSSSEVREALCVATLTGPVRAHLPDLLACTEAFGPNGNTNRIPASDALLDCYPAGNTEVIPDPLERSVAPVEPDLIAAHLLHTTPGRSILVKCLITSDTVAEHPAYRAQLIGALALAGKDYPDIGTDLKTHLADSLTDLIDAGDDGQTPLTELLAEHLTALTTAAVTAAADQDLTAARVLATALSLAMPGSEHRIDHAAADTLDLLPHAHPALSGLGVALATRALAHHEREADPAQIAAACGTFGIWLGVNGQRPEGLAAAQRAVGLYVELAGQNWAVYQPALATSVNNLANDLGAVGRRPEALKMGQYAVELYEKLAQQDPAAYQPALATSVNNLAKHLRAVGRRPEALKMGQRAVELYEKLAQQDPAAYQPHLAGSVNNLANRLGDAGRRPEALKMGQRAVELYEKLAQQDPAAYQPDLAMGVNNLAKHLRAVGRRPEALKMTQRAVELYEKLAQQDPAAYQPALATSVNNLAEHLGAVGRRRGALASALRAVNLREELVRQNRPAHLPDLATSVNNLAIHWSAVGRRREALASALRAVNLREELVRQNRPAHLPDLARSCWAAAYVRHLLAVEAVAGLAWCDRAIALYRDLAEDEPDAFAVDLAAVEKLRSEIARTGKKPLLRLLRRLNRILST